MAEVKWEAFKERYQSILEQLRVMDEVRIDLGFEGRKGLKYAKGGRTVRESYYDPIVQKKQGNHQRCFMVSGSQWNYGAISKLQETEAKASH